MKFGRNRPMVRARALSLGNYLTRSYAPPPATADYTPAAAAALAQMYENDVLGDCVVACKAHLEGIFTGNTDGGSPTIYSSDQINQAYGVDGGYVVGNPTTDQGCDEQFALQTWESQGFCGGARIEGWIRVNGADPVEVRAALYLFGNLMFGMELPDAWAQSLPSASGFTWDVAGPPNQANGHCVAGVGYVPGKIAISTWGLLGWLTDAAVAEYATLPLQGELYTVLSPDWGSKIGTAPNGFSMTALMADLDSMR